MHSVGTSIMVYQFNNIVTDCCNTQPSAKQVTALQKNTLQMSNTNCQDLVNKKALTNFSY